MAMISVAVAAHSKRQHLVDNLLDRLSWQKLPVVVSWDEGDDPWHTHQRAWEMGLVNGYPNITHVLVLQDDALPCRSLIPGLEMALANFPKGNTSPVSLYFGNAQNHPKVARAAQGARDQKASWIISSGFWWGVAAMLPVELVPEMIKFCAPRRENYDRRLTIWAEYSGHPVYYPWPSLVDHVDEESLIHPGRRPGRRAYQFVGEDYSALSFDPTGPTVACGRFPSPLAGRLNGKKGG